MIGYADVIADITATGTTLRENDLRILLDGTVMKSQSVMIGNARTLANDQNKLQHIRQILEKIDATLLKSDNHNASAKVEEHSELKMTSQSKKQRKFIGSYKQLLENIKPFSEPVQNQ